MASSLGKGAFRWIKQCIEKLPIPQITQSNQSIADSIIALVEEILNLKTNGGATLVAQTLIFSQTLKLC